MNAKNRENETPLYKAVLRENIELVKLLFENGADLNAREREEGFSPLHIASQKGQLEIFKILLKAGADIHITDWSNKFVSYYVGYDLSFPYTDEEKSKLKTVESEIEKLLEEAIRK